MNYYIYRITNLVNGKIYIGRRQTNKEPVTDSYMGSGTALHKAFEKYGLHNFKKDVVHICSTFEELCKTEAEIVNDEFIHRKDTYNLVEGGAFGGQTGKSASEDTRKKRSMTMIGRKLTDAHIANVKRSLTGRKLTAEHRLALTQVRHTDETKRRIADTQRGKQFSEAHKKKLSDTIMGSKNGMARSVVIDGVHYACLKDAGTMLGLSRYQLRKLLDTIK